MSSKMSKSDNELAIEELQKTKLEAEIIKLKEETKQIKKPWICQPSFLSSLVPVLVPVITILAAYYFGGGKQFFDLQKLNLEYDKKILSSQVDSFRKDTVGLRNRYLKASKLLMFEHLKDSIRLNDKLSEINNQLFIKTAELKKEDQRLKLNDDELKSEKVVIPIDTKIEELLSERFMYGALSGDYYNYDKLIKIIKVSKDRVRLMTYFQNRINDKKTQVLTKAFISSLAYFSFGDKHWKLILFEILNKNMVDDIIGNVNSDDKAYNYAAILQSKYWSKSELHDNNKFIIASVLKQVDSHSYEENMGEFLLLVLTKDREYDKSSFPLKLTLTEKTILDYKLLDTLMEPDKDKDAFFDFLTAYRKMTFTKKFIFAGDYSMHEKFENVFNAYLTEQLINAKDDEDRYRIMYEYDKVINLKTSFLSKEENPLNRGSLAKKIKGWMTWHENNKDLCKRLMEPEFRTYKNDVTLFMKDANYNPNKSRTTFF